MALYHYSFQWFLDQWFGKAGDKSGQQKDREQHTHSHANQEGNKRDEQSQQQSRGSTGKQNNKDDMIWLSEAGRYGIHSMEIIINGMLKIGALKANIRAKTFGGASVLPTGDRRRDFASVGEMNSRFIVEFLKNEGIRLVSSDLGGIEGRAIRFHSDDYSVYQRKIRRVIMPDLATRDEKYWQHETKKDYAEPELWGLRPKKTCT